MELYFKYKIRILKQLYIFKEKVIVINVTVNCYSIFDVGYLEVLQLYVALK